MHALPNTQTQKSLFFFNSKFQQSITFIWNSNTHWSQASPLIKNTQQKAKFTKTQSRKMKNHTFNNEFVMSLQKLAMSLQQITIFVFSLIKLFLNNYVVVLNSIDTPNLKPQNYHWIPSPNHLLQHGLSHDIITFGQSSSTALPSPAPSPLRGCPQCPQELLLLPHQLDNIK